MELSQSKSILAKLMATENLHIEQRNVGTASFDVENRILTIPILDKNISSDEYDLFLGHEVGHALYTPLDGLKRAFGLKLPMSVMNVIEDSRIERKIKQKYPGIRQNFIRAYKELVRKDFFGTQNKNINELNFIDRVNLHCKAGIELGITFSEDEKYLLNEIETTSSYEDVITVCKKVVVFMEEQQKEEAKQKKLQKKQKSEIIEDDEDEISEYDDGNQQSEPEEDEAEGDSTQSGKNAGNGTGGSDNSVNEKPENTLPQKDNDDSDEQEQPKPIVSETDQSYRRNEERLFSKENKTYYYGNVPTLELDKIVIDYKPLWKRHKDDIRKKLDEWGHATTRNGTNVEAFQKFRNDSKNVVSYLVKEFELRKNADQMKRASVAKTGELNMNKIYSYTFTEDIFKKITVTPGGKSHGLVMFIDWSGSMTDHIDNTIRQLLNLVMFCKKIAIPYDVYAFTDGYGDPGYQLFKKNDLMVSNFNLMNLLSSRMNAQDFSYAASALLAFGNRFDIKPDWFALNGTPLNESILAAMQIVPKFQKDNKLQVVNTVFLTDGEGNRNLSISDGAGGRYYDNSRSRSIYVIRDNVTKHEVFIDGNCSSRQLTSAHIKLLKYRTKCRVVGFYILSTREYGNVVKHYHDNLDVEQFNQLKQEFRNKKYNIVTNSGYDEYYLLKSDSLDTDEDTEFEVSENATTRGFVSAFTKFNNNRKTSRVVLNRFIGMIA